MSGSYDEVVWGILTTFLAFILGLAWRRLTQFLVNHRARRFWRPLVEGHLNVVLGRFRMQEFEPSGVVGAGDNIALKELADYLSQIGFKRFSVSYHDESGWNSDSATMPLTGNLILLGGPDANSVTREVVGRVPLGIEFHDISAAHLLAIRQGKAQIDVPLNDARRWTMRRARGLNSRRADWRVPVVVDSRSRQVYGPRVESDGLRADCGIMIRCPNPFNRESQVIIFCGSYGYGTWAAVRFAISDEFLRLLPKEGHAIECILSVEIFKDAPQLSQVELFRPLSPGDGISPDRTFIGPGNEPGNV